MNEWVWWVLAAVSIPLLIDAVIRILTLTVILPIFESRPPFNVRAANLDVRARKLRFATTDGLTLVGSLVMPAGRPRGLIVFCPEFGGSHASGADYLDGLIEAGFALFAFDFRNQGESDHEHGYLPTHWLTEREVEDAMAALRFIAEQRELRELPVGLFGVSRGGNAALASGARLPHVKAVAVEGAFSTDALMLHYGFRWAELYAPRWVLRLVPDWHLAGTLRLARRCNGWRRGVDYTILERWLPKLATRPVQLISGARDSYVTPRIAQRLREGISPDCNPVWIVPGAKHNQARWTAPEEFEQRLVDFYDDALGGFQAPADALVEQVPPPQHVVGVAR